MIKLFYQDQIGYLDRATIADEGITSLMLMERAATTVYQYIAQRTPQKVLIAAGPGNNGGDGLVVARLLSNDGWDVVVTTLRCEDEKLSADNRANLERLKQTGATIVSGPESIASLLKDTLVIDALFGTGLTRPLDGRAAQWVTEINASDCEVISIDIPSGLGSEAELHLCNQRPTIKADTTISFQMPKLAFLMPESGEYCGTWIVENIGLSPQAIHDTPSAFSFLESSDIKDMLRPRSRYAHKGTFGRALLLAGQHGMMGAAVMSARACMQGGVGLLTVAIPECGYEIMQTSVPEAMAICGIGERTLVWTEEMAHTRVDAIGIGPGLGRSTEARHTVEKALETWGGKAKMVIDADGLYHVAQMLKDNPSLRLPQDCVITPHPVEFDRLTEAHTSAWERIVAAQEFALKHEVTIVLKGAYTATISPDGDVTFNNNGNSGMATAGSGDMLTGIVLALLAQGYSTTDAALLAVNLHGNAGDKAAAQWGERGVTTTRMLSVF